MTNKRLMIAAAILFATIIMTSQARADEFKIIYKNDTGFLAYNHDERRLERIDKHHRKPRYSRPKIVYYEPVYAGESYRRKYKNTYAYKINHDHRRKRRYYRCD